MKNTSGTGSGDWIAIDYLELALSNPVPEPATMLLLGAGLIGFTGVRRKMKR